MKGKLMVSVKFPSIFSFEEVIDVNDYYYTKEKIGYFRYIQCRNCGHRNAFHKRRYGRHIAEICRICEKPL